MSLKIAIYKSGHFCPSRAFLPVSSFSLIDWIHSRAGGPIPLAESERRVR